MNASLENKVALVTGGSSGIGYATARELAERGAKVFITGRRQAEVERATEEIGHGVKGIQADSTQLSDLEHVFARIAEQAGRLDVLVVNAGGGDMLPLASITEEHVDRILATNFKGVLFTVQKALPVLSDGASVILTGSTAGSKGTANFSVYSATKAAVRSFARCWLLDVQQRGIRINVVSPGPIATPGLAGLVPAEQKDGLFAHFANSVPLGRLGEPQEVAKAMAFLASDDASFINGTELFVDGGIAQI